MISGKAWELNPARYAPINRGSIVYQIKLAPSGLVYTAGPDIDLLSAAANAGINVPAACRNGVCELCEARLLAGQVLNTRNHQRISVGERLMLCRSQALGDLELEICAVMAAGNIQPRKFQAKVVNVHSMNHDVYCVELQLPRRRELSFHAGQYLSVNLPDTEPCYFSIASSPAEQHIVLHIQASPDWVSAQKVIDALTPGSNVMLDIPHGKACLAVAPRKPLVLVAAGTGFAQMKSILDYLQSTSATQPVTLFWGVRHHEDMYLRSLTQQWAQEWPWFSFMPIIGDDADSDWSGHHDQLTRTVLASGIDWKNVNVLASGSPAMVYSLMDVLTEAGLPEHAFLSDVLEYAPRT